MNCTCGDPDHADSAKDLRAQLDDASACIERQREVIARLTTERDRLRVVNNANCLDTIAFHGELRVRTEEVEALKCQTKDAMDAAHEARAEVQRLQARIFATEKPRCEAHAVAMEGDIDGWWCEICRNTADVLAKRREKGG